MNYYQKKTNRKVVSNQAYFFLDERKYCNCGGDTVIRNCKRRKIVFLKFNNNFSPSSINKLLQFGKLWIAGFSEESSYFGRNDDESTDTRLKFS